jgi:bacterioferritin-associated ferredoxin
VQLDDKICYCYGVSLRKLVNFSRRVKPDRPSRMTECLNAGTGCGWCIPFLIKIAQNSEAFDITLTPEQYAENRKVYNTTCQPRNSFESQRS